MVAWVKKVAVKVATTGHILDTFTTRALLIEMMKALVGM